MTTTQRASVSPYTNLLAWLVWLPSKATPTRRPSRSTIGLPELPPVMSAVQTKLSGVDSSARARPSRTLGASAQSPWSPKPAARSNRPYSVVNGGTSVVAAA